jgi:DNA-3-methyladenine glycosylase
VSLVRDGPDGRRVGRIVETEAYGGPEDLASHARFGRTPRNAVMAGPPGIAYVYLVYGMYDCLNVVTGPDGEPAAVLIRAVEPLEGIDAMRAARLLVDARRRAMRHEAGRAASRDRIARTPDTAPPRGPGLVSAAFGIDTSWTGVDLCDPAASLRLEAPGGGAIEGSRVSVGPRVGVAYAGEDWAARPWRYAIDGHPSVSRPR